MHLIIVGAGPVGNSLVELALKARYDVVVVEPNAERAEHCADRYDVRVLNMEVSDENMAEEAGMSRALAVIATTTDDSTNLMAMFLGREHDVKTLTSAVNHLSHESMFRKLGVHVLTDPEILVAQHLLDLTLLPHAVDVTTLQDKEQVIEVRLGSGSPLAGRTVGEVANEGLLQRGLFLVSVQRDDEAFFPTAETRLEAGDQVIVFSRKAIRRKDLLLFHGDDQ